MAFFKLSPFVLRIIHVKVYHPKVCRGSVALLKEKLKSNATARCTCILHQNLSRKIAPVHCKHQYGVIWKEDFFSILKILSTQDSTFERFLYLKTATYAPHLVLKKFETCLWHALISNCTFKQYSTIVWWCLVSQEPLLTFTWVRNPSLDNHSIISRVCFKVFVDNFKYFATSLS